MSCDEFKSDSIKEESRENNIFYQIAQNFQKSSDEILNFILFPIIEGIWDFCKDIWASIEKAHTDVICILSSFPTYYQYCIIAKEFHSRNENSELYEKLIRSHFSCPDYLEWDIQKASSDYFKLLWDFVEKAEIWKNMSDDLKELLDKLKSIDELREFIGSIKSPKKRYKILKEYLNILPYIYNNAKTNALRNPIILLLWKSSFSESGKKLLYWKNYLEEIERIESKKSKEK